MLVGDVVMEIPRYELGFKSLVISRRLRAFSIHFRSSGVLKAEMMSSTWKARAIGGDVSVAGLKKSEGSFSDWVMPASRRVVVRKAFHSYAACFSP